MFVNRSQNAFSQLIIISTSNDKWVTSKHWVEIILSEKLLNCQIVVFTTIKNDIRTKYSIVIQDLAKIKKKASSFKMLRNESSNSVAITQGNKFNQIDHC